ncbi:MAG TPA: glycosyltransferase family 39 protein [Patescibacteria group bacterium]|nr:glycosyltransferase family 39 protein [Patescibacteria group bacterium]
MLSSRIANIIAVILLGIMFLTAVFSMKGDSLTFDELAHISAGYSYLAKQDYRLNPEHPPLIKDIPALPLLFLDLNFPDTGSNWLQKEAAPAWWVQFDLGNEFLYHSGNNPREIIFWSRFAMICFLIILGWLLFWWTKKIANNTVAVGVLTLFAFSPTFLAHGRLANTDVGAVFGGLLAIIFWLCFLQNPSWKNTLLAGLTFGVAMLFKFSLVLLIPFFAVITVIYALLFSKSLVSYLGKSLLAGLAGFILVIWPVYQFHIWHYPAEQQLRDTIADISSHPVPILKDLVLWMTGQEPLRAPAQYLRGLLMASQRTMWGNTTYFLGQISAGSWRYYFPLLYLLKIPAAFHLLTLSALAAFSATLWKIKKQKKILNYSRQYFWVITLFLWIAVYWTSAIAGNLNIGIRHLLPVFPFIYILAVFGVYQGFKLVKTPIKRRILASFFLLLFFCYAVSSLSAFPHYLSYYNVFGGGIKNGYKIAVDSNYDWGQDFYRLLAFVEKEKIEKIYLDYFGGEDPVFWLGEKYIKLNPKEIKEPPHGWLAVSLNQLMGGIAEPTTGFDQETGYYSWLKNQTPAAKAGHSIFIYYLD